MNAMGVLRPQSSRTHPFLFPFPVDKLDKPQATYCPFVQAV